VYVAQCGNFIILCEINFRDFRSPKIVIETHLDALNFDFSITLILREINFKNPWSAKSAIFKHLEDLNFDFYEFLHFRKTGIYPNQKFRIPKMAKKAFLNFCPLKNWFHVKCSNLSNAYKVFQKVCLQFELASLSRYGFLKTQKADYSKSMTRVSSLRFY